jgi:hypothetical protein
MSPSLKEPPFCLNPQEDIKKLCKAPIDVRGGGRRALLRSEPQSPLFPDLCQLVRQSTSRKKIAGYKDGQDKKFKVLFPVGHLQSPLANNKENDSNDITIER